MSAIAAARCAVTDSPLLPRRTVSRPSHAWNPTRATPASDGQRIDGRSRCERRAIAASPSMRTPISAATVRCVHSSQTWNPWSGRGRNWPSKQPGHVGQATPLFVARTTTPSVTSRNVVTTAAAARLWNRATEPPKRDAWEGLGERRHSTAPPHWTLLARFPWGGNRRPRSCQIPVGRESPLPELSDSRGAGTSQRGRVRFPPGGNSSILDSVDRAACPHASDNSVPTGDNALAHSHATGIQQKRGIKPPRVRFQGCDSPLWSPWRARSPSWRAARSAARRPRRRVRRRRPAPVRPRRMQAPRRVGGSRRPRLACSRT